MGIGAHPSHADALPKLGRQAVEDDVGIRNRRRRPLVFRISPKPPQQLDTDLALRRLRKVRQQSSHRLGMHEAGVDYARSMGFGKRGLDGGKMRSPSHDQVFGAEGIPEDAGIMRGLLSARQMARDVPALGGFRLYQFAQPGRGAGG